MPLEPLIRFAARDVPLKPLPINSSWIEGGSPEASGALLATSDDGAASVVLWACTAGRFTWRYSTDETIYFLDGDVTIAAPGVPARRFVAGDTIHFSRGSVATWTIDAHVRKIAFLRRAPPRRIAQALRAARDLVERWHRLRSEGWRGSKLAKI
jgi:hypothetical protein